MPSRLRPTFRESSTNRGMRLRHARASQRSSAPRAPAGSPWKTARSASLSRYPRHSAAPEPLSAPSEAAWPAVRSSGFLGRGSLSPLSALDGSVGGPSPYKPALREIRAFAAEKLKLEFNEKTQIFPVSEGVDYLGWRFYLTDTGKVIRRLRTSNKRRFKRRLKAFQEKYRSGEMDFDVIKRSLASYDGHLQHGHTWKLKTKVYGNFVLTKAPKRGQPVIPGKSRDRIN